MFAECVRTAIAPASWSLIANGTDARGRSVWRFGTAFAIDREGHLLTCSHSTSMNLEDDGEVIEPERIFVQREHGGVRISMPVRVLAREAASDLAVVGIPWRTQPVTLFDTGAAAIGTSCATYGHPHPGFALDHDGEIEYHPRVLSGVVSGAYVHEQKEGIGSAGWYDLDINTYWGCSGGAVFLPTGEVFGVLSRAQMFRHLEGYHPEYNLSVAVDIREALRLLRDLGLR